VRFQEDRIGPSGVGTVHSSDSPINVGSKSMLFRVDSDPASVLSVAGMAREAGLSRQHFTELFRHHFGMAPMKYVLQARMHRAAHLLRDQNLRVADVARAVGFEDPFHFSRSFRKEFGIPPRLFKNRQTAVASSM